MSTDLTYKKRTKIIIDEGQLMNTQPNNYEVWKRKSVSERKLQQSFLERNYTANVIKQEKNNYKLITETELNSILFRLKNYYNAITKDNDKTKTDLDAIKKINRELNSTVEDLRKSKEFSVNQKEKIIVSDAKENHDFIKAKIYQLDSELNSIKSKHKFEEEYTSTVNHMIEGNKLQLKKINVSIMKTESKLKEITKAHGVLSENKVQKDVIIKDYDKCLTTIDNQINDVENVIETQEIKQRKIDGSTLKKEEKVGRLKYSLDNKSTKKKVEIEKYKHDMLRQLDEFRFQKKQLTIKETNSINLILAMHLIQKYFINNDKENEANGYIDLKVINESFDYNVFCSNQYTIIDSNDAIMMTTQSTNRSSTAFSSKKKKAVAKKATIKAEDLKKMLDDLNITYENLYDYLLKIKTKEKFTREQMINLNEKAITMENKKMRHTKKVNEIIANDYKNFDDLIKLNSRFANFVQTNLKWIQTEQKAKKEHELSTYYLINYFISDNHIHPDIKEIKLNANRFLARSRTMFDNTKASLEELSNLLPKCGYFKDYDELSIESNIIPIVKQFNQSTTSFLKPTPLNTKDYLNKLLNYAIDKLNNEDAIYIKTLLTNEYNLKQILDSDWLFESEIFEFYYSLSNMKEMVKILEKLMSFYGSKLTDYYLSSHNGKEGTIRIRNSISNPVETNKLFFNMKNNAGDTRVLNTEYNNTATVVNFLNKRKRSQHHKSIKEPSSSTIHDRYHTHYNANNDTTEQTNDNQMDLDDSYDRKNKQISHNRPCTTRYTQSNSVTRRLYDPISHKNKYTRSLNECVNRAHKETLKNKRGEFAMNKKWKEIKIIKKEFYLYNNPSKCLLV